MVPRPRSLSSGSNIDEIQSAVAQEERLLVNAHMSADDNSSNGSSSSDSKPLRSKYSGISSPSQQAASDIARDQHDIFNLFALLLVVCITLSNWNFKKLLQGYGPGGAWTGGYFYENWAITVLYFVVDVVWVAVVPICVKSPDVIIKHHLVAIAYLSAPLAWPEYRWFMGACLSVEINTWFLILRRVVYKRRQHALSRWISDIVSFCFYASWILIRCFIYPALLVIFLQLAVEKVQTTEKLWHWPMVFIPVHFFLCVLNLKWSYDLFEPIVRKWFSADAEAPTVSSGL